MRPLHGLRDSAGRPARVGADGWRHIAAVDSFERCTADDYIRVFPRLLPAGGAVPVVLRDHMTRCAAVLVWRAARRGTPAAEMSASGLPNLEALGAREHGRWFCDAAGPPRSDAMASTEDVTDAREAIGLLDALRREIERDALRDFTVETAALFSFTTGIHAAYLWPEALLSHELFSAIGWVGHLWRRREAVLTADLAEYLTDVIDLAADGSPRIRDRHLARFLPHRGPHRRALAEVWRAVVARRTGFAPVAVLPEPAPDRTRVGPS